VRFGGQDFSASRFTRLAQRAGQFGNIDWIAPLPMRYYESKMTAVAEIVDWRGINEDAVDFPPTYDEENSEPVWCLPGAVSKPALPMLDRHCRRPWRPRSRPPNAANSATQHWPDPQS